MSDIWSSIFIKPQEGHTLPENFSDQFTDADGDFTYEKTLPPEDFDHCVDEAWVSYAPASSVGGEDTLAISFVTPELPLAWLNHLGITYPDLIIELEYHSLSGGFFGRTIWTHGGMVSDEEVDGFSRERFEYFGGDTDECEGWFHDEFNDECIQDAVEQVKSAQESKDWVYLMEALWNARYQLEHFENYDLPEDTLRLAMVTFPAALELMQAVLTDENVDCTAIAEQTWIGGETPLSRDDLLELIETIALQSALLLSLSSHHSTASEISRMKEKVA